MKNILKKQKNKTYVISDLHSHFDVFKRFLDDIGPEDRVYFLGDAIDKGPDGIKVLTYIMKDPRIQMLMGNHELMMLDYLISKRACENGIKNKNLDIMDKYMLERDERLWLDNNCGWSTLEDFFKLSREEQDEIERFIINLPLVIRINVGKQNYILVHAAPYTIPEYTPGAVLYLGNENMVNSYVWERYTDINIEDSIVVFGHTMSYHFQSLDENGKMQIAKQSYLDEKGKSVPVWYDIDCGLARNSDSSRLCALCLDDLSVKYYDIKEEEKINLNKDPEEFIKEYYDNKEKEMKEYLDSI